MTMISGDLHDVFLAMLRERNVEEPEITDHGDYLFAMPTRQGAVQVSAYDEDTTIAALLSRPVLSVIIVVRNLSPAGDVICQAKFTDTDPRLIAAHVLAYLT